MDTWFSLHCLVMCRMIGVNEVGGHSWIKLLWKAGSEWRFDRCEVWLCSTPLFPIYNTRVFLFSVSQTHRQSSQCSCHKLEHTIEDQLSWDLYIYLQYWWQQQLNLHPPGHIINPPGPRLQSVSWNNDDNWMGMHLPWKQRDSALWDFTLTWFLIHLRDGAIYYWDNAVELA